MPAVKLPTENPYEALAYLPFCGGYGSPPDETLVAFAKKWYKDFAAVPLRVSYDSVQFHFPENLFDEDDIRKASRDLFLINQDGVMEMDMNVREYAGSFIYGSRSVMLWWD